MASTNINVVAAQQSTAKGYKWLNEFPNFRRAMGRIVMPLP